MLVLNAARSTIRVVGKAQHDRRAALQHARARQAFGLVAGRDGLADRRLQDALLRLEDFRTRAPGSSGLKRGSRGVNFSWYKLRFR
jgi:hypothetical protein